MKKRFTIMLEKEVIDKVKKLYNYWTPIGVRETLEYIINEYVTEKIKILEEEKND